MRHFYNEFVLLFYTTPETRIVYYSPKYYGPSAARPHQILDPDKGGQIEIILCLFPNPYNRDNNPLRHEF